MTQPKPRVVIRGVEPEVECGRFAIKRTVGEIVAVEADIFTDGHDSIACVVRYRKADDSSWQETPMEFLGNDHWTARFIVEEMGPYVYTIVAWVDPFLTWYNDFLKRVAAGQDVAVDLRIGMVMLKAAAGRASGADAKKLAHAAEALSLEMVDERLAALAGRYADRTNATTYHELRVTVDRLRARFSTWYELFPRSHGGFKGVELMLPEIAGMGFDVIYFPPIHPIGERHRKGKNNSREAAAGEPGSPWAIGGKEGGHKSIHPELGTLVDFRRIIEAGKRYGIEIALDLAYQCSPDHPYVKEHPEWFRWRPDGTVQYAENPPKKYEDIYPFEFETPQWEALWTELKSIVEHWVAQGVRIFRVDNPHTKPFSFWEWMITDLKGKHPDLIFLSEAFTRPNIMYRLGKLGFTQSYTYFTWRNTKTELAAYLTELTATPVREFFRPNFWPNTPDILHEYLQKGGRPAFMIRLVLAATLSSNYGMYGPAYELCENTAKAEGSEEYLNSEKYEIKARDLPGALRPFITRVNAIRRENPSLQTTTGVHFHHIDNDRLMCYSKGPVIVIVSLNPLWMEAGFVHLPLEDLGIDPRRPYAVRDLLTDAKYTWQGPRNYVELRPEMPAHILRKE
jgi:starch synthase (maltosyl-transferring)